MSTTASEKLFLGIDIGSVSLGYVLINQHRQIRKTAYLTHHGNIIQLLSAELKKNDLSRVQQIAFNHKAAEFFKFGLSVNEQVALIEGVHLQLANVGSVFVIGGETFGLILFNEQGQYQKLISNSACAAGTGAFLDQQAQRLGLASSAEISQLAETFNGEPPKIATRCAVFAKTDLIHCQQQGYSLAAISAGLCKGLAQNIADTLIKGVNLREPVLVVGGVSQNQKVIRYLSEIINCPIKIPEKAVLTGAIGCALLAHRNCLEAVLPAGLTPETILEKETQKKHYFFPPLAATKLVYPDFSEHSRFVIDNVEVDLYDLPAEKRIPVYLGIDIGSTSTKAILVNARDHKSRPLIGLYTRTLGQPIQATQTLLRVLQQLAEKHRLQFEFWGVGTTGSGRKFIQKVLNADLAIDEITAHARAACLLNPQVDTIIEIGGQDSKFTVLKEGQVTFSVMNYVCAAGTGSFIEEQAKRLNVPLDEYTARVSGTPAPLSSDRCTVFMERDLNYFLSQGFTKNELLTAVLHSVRDNYLSKVAHLNKIGQVLCFQGATAKNKALVMAFEQKLQKPIFVSKYCHLTGALGICLLLQEQHRRQSQFRGIEFYQETPLVSDDICGGCKNHCKLKIIQIGNERIVWGYLCGKDEADSQKIGGFDLLSRRRRIFSTQSYLEEHPICTHEADQELLLTDTNQLHFEAFMEKLKQIHSDLSWEKLKQLSQDWSFDKLKQFNLDRSLDRLYQSFEMNLMNLRHRLFTIHKDEIEAVKNKNKITIGLPNTLYLLEYIPFWELFFRTLGYSVIISTPAVKCLEKGKEIAGAEFCAPISNWHGHVQALSERVDYLFLPHIFQEGDAESASSKFYCYYSNYAVSMVQNIEGLASNEKSISPIIDFSKSAVYNLQQIYESLPPNLKFVQTPGELREAYSTAWTWFQAQKKQLIQVFLQQQLQIDDISVVLLGRPYLIFDPVMNKNIPAKFYKLGVKAFFQDMLPPLAGGIEKPGQEFIDWNHWKYGADILETAEYIGRKAGLYPVLLTAFKCSPDSFVLRYFKDILDAHHKPYLILQLDEHGSDVGYETRIEAAVRSFRNHFQQQRPASLSKLSPGLQRTPPAESTILIPNYDSLSCSLISAALGHYGFQTRLLEETPVSIISSLRLNDGQCLPISAIVSAAIDTIKKYELDPAKTALFINAIIRTACNLPQYPLMIKKLLEQEGAGFEQVQVFATEFEMRGFPLEVIYDIYCSYLLGGLLRRIGCRLRPYELIAGQTDRLLETARARLYQCISSGGAKESLFKEIIDEFMAMPIDSTVEKRPRVSIIGDLYVRDNDIFNQHLIKALENNGAEVVTTPFNYIIRMLAIKRNYQSWQEGHYFSLMRDKLLIDVLEKFEKRFFKIANRILDEDFPTFDISIFNKLKHYNLSLKHGGETAQNLIKIFCLLEHYPDIKLIVHVNPIFCCPGLVSESLFKRVEKEIGLPIISIIYDGTTTNPNEVIAPYLHFIKQVTTQSMTPKNMLLNEPAELL